MKLRRYTLVFTRSKQLLSLVLCASLIWSSSHLAEAAGSLAPSLARSVENELTPPSSLGIVTDLFNAPAATKRVILIQDLHAHYGVQKNISGILDFLTEKMSSRGPAGGMAGTWRSQTSEIATLPSVARNDSGSLPFALAVEGASGPIDSSVMALFPDQKIKQAAADYLMREGELTGAEYFAVMRGLPQALNGVEDMTYYQLHRDLFRKTLEDREKLVGILKGYQAQLASLRHQVYSKALKHFQHKLDLYERGDVSQGDMADWLAGKAQAFDIAANGRSNEDILSIAYILKTQMATTQGEKDLIQVEHDLALLLKVADLQATESDVRSFGPRTNQFIALSKALITSGDSVSRSTGQSDDPTHRLTDSPTHPLFNETALRQLISSSIDYYAMALMRNKPMVDNTLALIGARLGNKAITNLSPTPPIAQSPNTAVLVAGGFHTAPITQMLRAQNISYLVITPTVDKLTQADHDLYTKRLSGDLLTREEILTQANDRHSKLAYLVRKDNALSLTKLFANIPAQNSSGDTQGLAVGIMGKMLTRSFLFLALGIFALTNHASAATALPKFEKEELQSYSAAQQNTIKQWEKEASEETSSNGITITTSLVKNSTEEDFDRAIQPALEDLSSLRADHPDLAEQYRKNVLDALMKIKEDRLSLKSEDGLVEISNRFEKAAEFLLNEHYFVYLLPVQDEKGRPTLTNFRAALFHLSSSQTRIIGGKNTRAFTVDKISGAPSIFSSQLAVAATAIPDTIFLFEQEHESLAKRLNDLRDAKGEKRKDAWHALNDYFPFDDAFIQDIVLEFIRDIPADKLLDTLITQDWQHETVHTIFGVNRVSVREAEIPSYLNEIVFSEHPYFHLVDLAGHLKNLEIYNETEKRQLANAVASDTILNGLLDKLLQAGHITQKERKSQHYKHIRTGDQAVAAIRLLRSKSISNQQVRDAAKEFFEEKFHDLLPFTQISSIHDEDQLLAITNDSKSPAPLARRSLGEGGPAGGLTARLLSEDRGSETTTLMLGAMFVAGALAGAYFIFHQWFFVAQVAMVMVGVGAMRHQANRFTAAWYRKIYEKRLEDQKAELAVQRQPYRGMRIVPIFIGALSALAGLYGTHSFSLKEVLTADMNGWPALLMLPFAVGMLRRPKQQEKASDINLENNAPAGTDQIISPASRVSEEQTFITGKLTYLQAQMQKSNVPYNSLLDSISVHLSPSSQELLESALKEMGLKEDSSDQTPLPSLLASSLYILDAMKDTKTFDESVLIQLSNISQTYNANSSFVSSSGLLSLPLLFSLAVSAMADDEPNLLRLVENLTRLPGRATDDIVAFHLLQQGMHEAGSGYMGSEAIERLLQSALERIKDTRTSPASAEKLKLGVIRGLESFRTSSTNLLPLPKVLHQYDPQLILSWIKTIGVLESQNPVPVVAFMFDMGTEVLHYNVGLPISLDAILMNPWSAQNRKLLQNVMTRKMKDFVEENDDNYAAQNYLKTGLYKTPEAILEMYGNLTTGFQRASRTAPVVFSAEEKIINGNLDIIFSQEFNRLVGQESMGGWHLPKGRVAVNGAIDKEGRIVGLGNYLEQEMKERFDKNEVFAFTIQPALRAPLLPQAEGPDYLLVNTDAVPQSVLAVLRATVLRANQRTEQKNQKQSLAAGEIDSIISSHGKKGWRRVEHIKYDKKAKFKEGIESTVQELEAIGIQVPIVYAKDGSIRYDLRTAIENAPAKRAMTLETPQGMIKVVKGLPAWMKLRLESDGIVVLILDSPNIPNSPRFEADSAGRSGMVMARSEQLARHELAELRDLALWAVTSKVASLMDVRLGLLGVKIREWLNEPDLKDPLLTKRKMDFFEASKHAHTTGEIAEVHPILLFPEGYRESHIDFRGTGILSHERDLDLSIVAADKELDRFISSQGTFQKESDPDHIHTLATLTIDETGIDVLKHSSNKESVENRTNPSSVAPLNSRVPPAAFHGDYSDEQRARLETHAELTIGPDGLPVPPTSSATDGALSLPENYTYGLDFFSDPGKLDLAQKKLRELRVPWQRTILLGTIQLATQLFLSPILEHRDVAKAWTEEEQNKLLDRHELLGENPSQRQIKRRARRAQGLITIHEAMDVARQGTYLGLDAAWDHVQMVVKEFEIGISLGDELVAALVSNDKEILDTNPEFRATLANVYTHFEHNRNNPDAALALDNTDEPVLNRDPWDPQKVGLEDQMEAIQGKTLDQLADVGVAIGDIDSLGNINKLMTKDIVGSLDAKPSSHLLFNKREESLYREGRQEFRNTIRGRSMNINAGNGGDEFELFYVRDKENMRQPTDFVTATRESAQEFSKRFHDHYGFVRIEKAKPRNNIELTAEQIAMIKQIPSAQMLAPQNNGYGLLLDRSGLDDKAVEQVVEQIHASLTKLDPASSYSVHWLNYEYEQIDTWKGFVDEIRGMYTISIGVVPSLKMVMEYLISLPGQKEEDWLTQGVLRDDRREELLFWAKCIANDLERRAKQEQPVPKNRILAPEPGTSFDPYLFEPITTKKILAKRKALRNKAPALDIEMGLEDWETYEEDTTRMTALTLYTVGSYLGRGYEERAFHVAKEKTGGEAAGDHIVHAWATAVTRSVRPWFIRVLLFLHVPLWVIPVRYRIVISRKAPDNFYVLSQDVENIGKPSLLATFKNTLQKEASTSEALLALAPHVFKFQVTDEDLQQLKGTPLESAFRNKMEAIHVMTGVHPQTLEDQNLATVMPSEEPETTLFRFNSGKAGELLAAYRDAEEIRMYKGYYDLAWTPIEGDRRLSPRRRRGVPNEMEVARMMKRILDAAAGDAQHGLSDYLKEARTAIEKLRLRASTTGHKIRFERPSSELPLKHLYDDPLVYATLEIQSDFEKRHLNPEIIKKILAILAPEGWSELNHNLPHTGMNLKRVEDLAGAMSKHLILVEKAIASMQKKRALDETESENTSGVAGGTWIRHTHYALIGAPVLESKFLMDVMSRIDTTYHVTSIGLAVLAGTLFFVPHLIQLMSSQNKGKPLSERTNAFSDEVLVMTFLTSLAASLLPYLGDASSALRSATSYILWAIHSLINYRANKKARTETLIKTVSAAAQLEADANKAAAVSADQVDQEDGVLKQLLGKLGLPAFNFSATRVKLKDARQAFLAGA